MKILIAGSVNEYSSYEEEGIVKILAEELKRKGHTVDSFLLPYKPDPLTLPDQILAYSMLDVNTAELLITVGYPACVIEHPRKIIYLLETVPMLHEYWDTEYGVLGNRQYSDILITVNNIEQRCFNEAKRVFCASKILQNDLRSRHGLSASLLPFPVLPPKETAEVRDCKEKYFITESCLLQNSRYLEFLEILKNRPDIKVCWFIPNADKVYSESLNRTVNVLRLEEKVHIYMGSPSDSVIEKAEAYIHFPFESRRADNILKRCICKGIPIEAAADSGYGAELSKEYSNVNVVGFTGILSEKKYTGRSPAVPQDMISPEKFSESVIDL